MNTILTTNHKIVNDMITDRYLPEKYLSADWKVLFQRYQTSFNTNKFLYDRSGNTPHYLNIDQESYKIPKVPNGFNLSFQEVCEKRAKYLLSLGKPINISWSGGIDSTFVFLTLCNFANDKDQIKIYGTYNSIIESGHFFDKHIKDKFRYDIHVNRSYKKNYICSDEIFVSGSMGNNIFYQDLNTWQPDSWMKFRGNVENPIKFYSDKPYQNALQEDNLEFLENSISKSPRNIETLQDLRWWIQFAFNWHSTKSNSYIEIGAERAKKVHAFFDSTEFQLWSITNTDVPSKLGDYSDERWQMRDMIEYYTGDSYYSKTKKNVTSVLSPFNPEWIFLMSDYTNIYKNML